jgi:tripartite-type tricarboxylate transporter receptor subunit TctC
MTKLLLSRRRILQGASALGAMAALSTRNVARAAAYPEHDLRWIIYQSPGGLIDGSTRRSSHS